MSRSEREHPAYKHGTDREFLRWVSHQPSVISGLFHQYNPDRSIPAHVRRISDGAGLGQKPPFSCVPLRQIEHDVQGLHGEARALKMFHPMYYEWTESEARSWFEDRRDEMVDKWIASKVRK